MEYGGSKMDMSKNFSGIIPTHSLHKELEFMIKSFFDNSEIRGHELIIILNKPTKEVKMVAHEAEEKYESILVRNGPTNDPYVSYNFGATLSKFDNLIFLNDDLYMAKNWDKPMLKILEAGTIVTHMPFGSEFLESNEKNPFALPYGKSLDEFDKEAFDAFVDDISEEGAREGIIFYMPSAFKKSDFIKLGGFKTDPPFPFPHDVEFFQHAMSRGMRLRIALNSASYHFIRGTLRKQRQNRS